MSNGILGDIFDLNNDGEVDALELGVEFMVLDKILNEDKEDDD